jgi:hypothetical protein
MDDWSNKLVMLESPDIWVNYVDGDHPEQWTADDNPIYGINGWIWGGWNTLEPTIDAVNNYSIEGYTGKYGIRFRMDSGVLDWTKGDLVLSQNVSGTSSTGIDISGYITPGTWYVLTSSGYFTSNFDNDPDTLSTGFWIDAGTPYSNPYRPHGWGAEGNDTVGWDFDNATAPYGKANEDGIHAEVLMKATESTTMMSHGDALGSWLDDNSGELTLQIYEADNIDPVEVTMKIDVEGYAWTGDVVRAYLLEKNYQHTSIFIRIYYTDDTYREAYCSNTYNSSYGAYMASITIPEADNGKTYSHLCIGRDFSPDKNTDLVYDTEIVVVRAFVYNWWNGMQIVTDDLLGNEATVINLNEEYGSMFDPQYTTPYEMPRYIRLLSKYVMYMTRNWPDEMFIHIGH